MKRYCVNIECINKTGCVKVDHEEFGPTTEPGLTAKFLKYKCTICGHEFNEVAPRVTQKKQVGKFYHEGLGQTFDDPGHEKAWTKANGYEAV